jgi:membrane-associated protein
MIAWIIDFILHLDRHLAALLADVGIWTYPILFSIIFAQTGVVIAVFLPGDSLLFGIGTLAAVDKTGTLNAPLASLVLGLAAVLGYAVNYGFGRWVGPPAFSGRYRLLKVEYLRRTEAFFQRHGGKAVGLSCFIPVIRTCMPFVAGVGRMSFPRFQLYSLVGGFAWVLLLLWGGYFFGNVPLVRRNFGVVTLLIIAVSLLPVALPLLKRRAAPAP